MTKKSALGFLLAIACLTALAAPAAAAMNWGGEVFGAFSTHSMNDWNDRVIAPANQSGANIDEFSTGFGGGLGLRMWPNSNWMLSATWEPLFVSRKDDVSGGKINLDANAFELTGGYFFPTTSQVKFGLGAGLGVYQLGGEITGGGGPDVKVEGNAVGFHLHGLMEYLVSPGFAITGNAGYRFADITDTEIDGQSVDPKLSTDYSGLALRAGFAFYLPGTGQ